MICAGAAEPATGNQLRGHGGELRVQVHLDTDSGAAEVRHSILGTGSDGHCAACKPLW